MSSVGDLEPASSRAQRPNIVVVMLDDFSMDLVQTMRSAQTMKRAGASYPHSFVTDSLCCVSRSSFFTGQYPHQTGVRTNTSDQGTSTLGGWPAFDVHGNPERAFNVRLQEAGYTTGFVGKFLNEYEWTPGRALPPAVPGWSTFNTVFGSAYDGWDFASTTVTDQRLAVEQHPAPPATASVEEKDAAYAGTFIGDRALDFIRTGNAGDAPWFLEVSVYGPHNRTQPEGHYLGDPLFPSMFRDRAGQRSCGRVACRKLTVQDLPGFGDSRADNRPRKRNGKPARAWNTRRRAVGRRRGARPARPGADVAVGRPAGAADPGRGTARTPTSSSPPTTASTSASSAWAGARARRTTPTSACRSWSPDPAWCPARARR